MANSFQHIFIKDCKDKKLLLMFLDLITKFLFLYLNFSENCFEYPTTHDSVSQDIKNISSLNRYLKLISLQLMLNILL